MRKQFANSIQSQPSSTMKLQNKKLHSHGHSQTSTSKSKRKRQSNSNSKSTFDFNANFSLLLAAVSNPNNPSSASVITKCLTDLHFALHPQQILPPPILSLLPLLILSERPGIASRAAEIVGACSIMSLRMNEVIALDAAVVRALILALACSKRRVALAACNAVMDLSTTSIGRWSLVQVSAIELLLSAFLQVSASSEMQVSIGTVYYGNSGTLKTGFKGDELSILILNAAIVLINTCHFKHLEMIPCCYLKTLLAFLKKQWIEVRDKMIRINNIECSLQEQFDMSNIGTNDLAVSIFKISVCTNQVCRVFPVKEVKTFLGLSGPKFEDFMLNHWEALPLLMQKPSRTINEEADIMRSILGSVASTESIHSFISPMLGRLVSCNPIASDELDIHNFLEEVRNELGFSLIYQQDIRVLRTDECSKREIHYFQKNFEPCCTKGPCFLKLDDAHKCEEAFKEGYTIALRGMEFRYEKIAAIANTIASLFGQPSVGANMYLTPPGSQGLARHYDDHCVFVCQLAGSKQWTVFNPPKIWLPRLYDAHEFPRYSEVDSPREVGRQFILKEGDILYIPRGFLHEACTENEGPDGSSLHLTFGIEVEPPFEWEGFVHTALYCWNDNAKQYDASSRTLSVELLHFAIWLISVSDQNFRKACLVLANLSFSDTDNRGHDLNQKTIFSRLIDKINRESKFLEVLASIKISVEKDDDPFHRMRWLRLLNLDSKESIKEDKWTFPSIGMGNLLSACVNRREQVETTFVEVKSRFCSEVRFENVVECYKKLLERYRKVRSQYTTGMISLH